MSSFTEAERKAEAKRRQNQRRDSPYGYPETECLHCGRRFPAHEATSQEMPLCPSCL